MGLASSTGAQLERALNFSRTKSGQKHRRQRHHMDTPCSCCGKLRSACPGPSSPKDVCCAECWHPHTIHVRETRCFAPRSSAGDALEQQALVDGALAKLRALLTADEFQVMVWQGKLETETPILTIDKGDFEAYKALGYKFLRNNNYHSKDGATLERVDVQLRMETLSYAEMAERLGKSIGWVNKLVSRSKRKMRLAGAGELIRL